MPAPISTANADHYTWGGPDHDRADGWHLLRSDELSIIEENLPPDSSEVRHHHVRSRQFFYVLEGALTLRFDECALILHSSEGIEVVSGTAHQAVNNGEVPARFLVISQPPSHGDRIE